MKYYEKPILTTVQVELEDIVAASPADTTYGHEFDIKEIFGGLFN